jgi:hypothetical protein
MHLSRKYLEDLGDLAPLTDHEVLIGLQQE